jgi:O-antigen ligase
VVLGTFEHINPMIMSPSNSDALGNIGGPDDLYIQWLAKAGIPATVLMVALAGVIAIQLLLGAVRRRRPRIWTLSIVAVLALFALQSATEFSLQTSSTALVLALLLGLGAEAADAAILERFGLDDRSLSKPLRAWEGS